MRRTSHVILVLTASSALALAGCTGSVGPEDPSPHTPATPTESERPSETTAEEESPIPAETTAPETPAGEPFTPADQSMESVGFMDTAGGDLIMLSIETPTPDRYVITLEGTTVPEWLAEYPAEPTTQAKGDLVVLESPFIFGLILHGFTYPDAEWELQTPDGADIFVDPPFEGTMAVYLGRPAAQDYRLTITPGSIVIEFRSQ